MDNRDILEVEQSVEGMARKGLRTLLYGVKEIDWDGSIDPLDLEVETIECDLELLAATGVEDLLQERVKECIEDFRAAGISVWMLTGDKGLTAKEIGVSCGLIPQDTASDAATGHATADAKTSQAVSEMHSQFPANSGESQQNVLTFEDSDTDPTQLYEKIQQFVQQATRLKSY